MAATASPIAVDRRAGLAGGLRRVAVRVATGPGRAAPRRRWPTTSGTLSTRPQPWHGNAPWVGTSASGCFSAAIGALQDRRHGSAVALLRGRGRVAHTNERLERARGAAIVDRDRRRRHPHFRDRARAPPRRARPPCSAPRCRGASPFRLRALHGSPARSRPRRRPPACRPTRRGIPRSSGSSVKDRTSPSTSSCTVLVVDVVSSSSPSSPWNTMACSVPSTRSAPSIRVGHRLVAHADGLALHVRRVRERAEEVERRGHPELRARGPEEAHRGVITRREAEPDAGFGDTSRHAVGTELDRHAERFEHVGRAAFRRGGSVAVLHDRAPAPAAMSAAIVETLMVPDRSPPVPHVSIAPAATRRVRRNGAACAPTPRAPRPTRPSSAARR